MWYEISRTLNPYYTIRAESNTKETSKITGVVFNSLEQNSIQQTNRERLR